MNCRYSKEEIASWPDGYKRCIECSVIHPLSMFAKSKGVLGRRNQCRLCRAPEFKRMYAVLSFEDTMLRSAQHRAKIKGWECNITLEDITIPPICPVLKIPIEMTRGSEYAPSLDRIDSSCGYVKGNIQVISQRANKLKNDMTVQEARLLVAHLEQISLEDEHFGYACLHNLLFEGQNSNIEA